MLIIAILIILTVLLIAQIFLSLTEKSEVIGMAEAIDPFTIPHEQIVHWDLPKLPYFARYGQYSTTVHWGQRKLLLMEVKFLLACRERKLNADLVIYVGSAPGDHIPLLFEWFPEFTWHLYDPRPFCRELVKNKTGKIKLFNAFFTEETCKQYKGKRVILISDLRTINTEVDTHNPTNAAIKDEFIREDRVNDLNLQKNIYVLLQPAATSIKFALPYPAAGQSDDYEYLSGEIWFQPYPPQSSTESRLIV